MTVRGLSPAATRFLTMLAMQPAILVRVGATQGSVPREVGAWMAVFANVVVGTIGGGHLEFQAIVQARAALDGGGDVDDSSETAAAPVQTRFALGPSLGQCCGGVVHLDFTPVGAADAPALARELRTSLTPVALFGGGHVGQALARVLAPLPFALTWIDSRDGVFPQDLPAHVVCEQSDPVQSAVSGLAPQSRVLIMSFSHAEDLEVVAACLMRQRQKVDLPYVGLIGSKTKWATFSRRLQARGFTPAELSQITCPIGMTSITGKEPEVIAVGVATQLLQTLAKP